VTQPWEIAPPAELADLAPPRIDSDEVPTCGACGSDRFEAVAVGFDYELLTCSNAWRFVACSSCGHVWLNPRPAASALSTIYPPTYYAYNYEEEVGGIARRGKEALDRLKFRGLLKALDRPPRSYLDIGCGDGRFLRLMEGRGVPRSRNHGIEMDPDAVEPLAAAGYQAFCGRVEDCDEIAPGSIDLATMFHVIEHVADPAAVISEVSDWLAPGGLFAVETPNLDSLDRRLFSAGLWGGYHIPRHWHLFRERTLSRLLTDAGLEVTEVDYLPGHSFWMYSFHHLLRYGRRPRPWLARRFDPFKGLLPFLLVFTGFDKLRAGVGARTSSMLILARKAGEV
jgi:SAM-dependent methyltransferase